MMTMILRLCLSPEIPITSVLSLNCETLTKNIRLSKASSIIFLAAALLPTGCVIMIQTVAFSYLFWCSFSTCSDANTNTFIVHMNICLSTCAPLFCLCSSQLMLLRSFIPLYKVFLSSTYVVQLTSFA